jgi:hypothetical protein
MGDRVELKVAGFDAVRTQMLALPEKIRRGVALRILKKAAEPILAKAVAETPRLRADVYSKGKLYRRAGLLKSSLKVRTSKDAKADGDVGVFINIVPLKKAAISNFKLATGRKGAENPNDPFFWRFNMFATRKNKNPSRFLQKAGETLVAVALPIITAELKAYFERLNKRLAKK